MTRGQMVLAALLAAILIVLSVNVVVAGTSGTQPVPATQESTERRAVSRQVFDHESGSSATLFRLWSDGSVDGIYLGPGGGGSWFKVPYQESASREKGTQDTR